MDKSATLLNSAVSRAFFCTRVGTKVTKIWVVYWQIHCHTTKQQAIHLLSILALSNSGPDLTEGAEKCPQNIGIDMLNLLTKVKS